MTVNVLLITHEDVGSVLLHAVKIMLGELSLPTTVVPILYDDDPENLLPRLQKQAETIEHHQGLLILTDLFGSTPCNIATKLQKNHRIRLVTGLNLPMLIRVMNYPTLSINELAVKAASGGKDGIQLCEGVAA